MTKTRKSFLTGTEMMRLRRLKITKCKTCNKELTVGDKVTFAKPFNPKGYWNPHHTVCWEKKLQ